MALHQSLASKLMVLLSFATQNPTDISDCKNKDNIYYRENLIIAFSVNLVVQNMNHIYLSYPETESMNVCPVGHPLISTLCLWEREICNFSR